MKKIIISISLISILVCNGYTQIIDKTIAVVTLYKTENVSRTKFNQQLGILQKQTGQSVTDEIKETVLDAVINDILISQAAEKAGVVATNKQIDDAIKQQKTVLGVPISDDDLKDLIVSQSGLSWEEYRQQVKNRIIQEQYIYQIYGNEINKIEDPTKNEIEEAYELYATEFTNPAMVRVEHLFWDTRDSTSTVAPAEAKKIASEINGSASKFDQYMKSSVDDSSYEGGDLGYIIRDENTYKILGRSFIDAVFSMKKDGVSNLMKSNVGYHIVRITDKRNPKLLLLDDPIFPGERVTVKDRVESSLINQKQQIKFLELVKKEVDSLRERAKIRIISKNY